jgi:hypothetical protein
MADPILDYREPDRPPNKPVAISGWISLLLSLMVIPLAWVGAMATLWILVFAILAGVHSQQVTRGRSIPGWIGLGTIVLLFLRALLHL